MKYINEKSERVAVRNENALSGGEKNQKHKENAAQSIIGIIKKIT